MDLRALYQTLLGAIEADWLLERTEALWRHELGQTSRHHDDAAMLTEVLMREVGLDDVQRLACPADGRTTFQDKTSPLRWHATTGRLRVVQARASFDDPVVADYARHPFHLIRGSTATPPEGILTRLLTQDDAFGGADARGAMVLANPDARPRAPLLPAVLDLGALGLVSDHLTHAHLTPDGIQWVNACTEGPHWHPIASDRPFVGFSVSPNTGAHLRAACRAGPVTVHVLCDGRRDEGEVDLVTGVFPGADPRELWLLAHLYEPLPDDNSAGVAAALAIAKALADLRRGGRLAAPHFTLRLLCGHEMYGFAAAAEHFGDCLRDRVVGAINLDGVPCFDLPVTVYLAPAGSPGAGDYLLEHLVDEVRADFRPPIASVDDRGLYADDTFLSDATTGVPTVWVRGGSHYWHNSCQTMADFDGGAFRRGTALAGTWVAAMLGLDPDAIAHWAPRALHLARRRLGSEADAILADWQGEERGDRLASARDLHVRLALCHRREHDRLADFARLGGGPAVAAVLAQLAADHDRLVAETAAAVGLPAPFAPPPPAAPAGKWERLAAGMVSARATVGLPYDLADVPKADRHPLPDHCIYGPLAWVLASMDGRRDLLTLLREAQWHTGRPVLAQARQYVHAVDYLSDHGYLETTREITLGQADIEAALRDAGLEAGDLVLLHSGLSHCGYIAGGAETVLAAFAAVLGPAGTLLLPTFTRPFIYFRDQPVHELAYRPWDPATSPIWVGRVPQVFVRQAGVRRSVHPTHSVAGRGPLAAALLAEHREDDPPTCRRSPFGKLLDYPHAKMVWFGAGLSSATFLHFLEDELRLPYLGEAVVRIADPDGGLRTVLIPRHLPGHRDFYREPAEETKVFRRLLADGLLIRRARLGVGDVKVIAARSFSDLGLAALRQQPDLLLCDARECLFCARHRRPRPAP